jgi:hypothetical protein
MSLKIFDSVARRLDLTPADKFVLSYLQAINEHKRKERKCEPSIRSIARETSLSRQHTSKALDRLVAKSATARTRPNPYHPYQYALAPHEGDGYTFVRDPVLALPLAIHKKLLLACLHRCDSIRDHFDNPNQGTREFTIDELSTMSGLHWQTVVRGLNALRALGQIDLSEPLPLRAKVRGDPLYFHIPPQDFPQ